MTEEITRKDLRNQKKTKKPIFRIIKWVLLILFTLFLIGTGVFAYYASKAPELSESKLQDAGAATLYTRDGKKFLNIGNEQHDYTKIDKVPKKLQDAVISIEDRRFYKEPLGIDPIRIVTSGISNIRSNSIQGGGSTITQQLVKLSFFSTKKSDQTYKRKIQEAWLAMKVEKKYSKDQILEYYLNKVYLANGVTGVKTAADYYFNKNMKELTLAQTALIAGMPQSPNGYDPYVHPEKAKERRDNVLRAMYKNNKISEEEMNTAINTPITDGLQSKQSQTADSETRKVSDPYIKEVIKEIKKKGYDPYRDNIKVTTNMDYDAQKYLYNIVNSSTYIGFPDSKIQVASTVVDPNNGEVITMIGGRNQGDVQLGYNRAVESTRSNGSTMKPLLDYAPAMEYLDWSTYHPLTDEPYVYPGTSISLHDVDGQYMGKMTLRNALSKSRNIPAVKTLNEVGFDRAKEFVSQMGIDIPDDAGLSAGIGSNVSTLQNAAAYSAFANGGYYRKPFYVSKIKTADGVTHNYDSSAKRVMKESTAFMITDVLKAVVQPGGLGSNASISGLYQAGKTGTTDYSDKELAANPALTGLAKDAWFAGYTKNYSMSVWTGYDTPSQNGLSLANRTISQLTYKYMMSYLQQNKSNEDWTAPGSIVKHNNEWFLSGTVPATYDSDITGIVNSSDEEKDTDTNESEDDDSESEDTNSNEDTNDNNSTDTDSENSNTDNTNNDDSTQNTNNNNSTDTTDSETRNNKTEQNNSAIVTDKQKSKKNWYKKSTKNRKLINLLSFSLMI